MDLIEVHGVGRQYGEGQVRVSALRDVDMRVRAGEFVAIMGPSGSGKSTLLNLLGGIDVPTTGEIYLEGTPLSQMNDDERTILRRRRIGFIFQKIHLLPILSAGENVALPLQLNGMSRKDALEIAANMLQLVGLQHRLKHLPNEMSGGEQQRVAIARALAIEPAIVLADEPTGSLDSANGKQITQLMRKLVEEHGQTIIMVTHDTHVASLADRLVTVRDGHVTEQPSTMAVHSH
ncbi:MAG: ABC transporter ATP-binding protein [Pirellulales bacterium]